MWVKLAHPESHIQWKKKRTFQLFCILLIKHTIPKQASSHRFFADLQTQAQKLYISSGKLYIKPIDYLIPCPKAKFLL